MAKDSLVLEKYQRVPIERLNEVKASLARSGVKYRVRYRGPRAKATGDYRNDTVRYRSECLRQNATHFTVYLR